MASTAGPAVEAILGFRPSNFLSDVSEAVDRQLVADVENFKKELQTVATSKGYKAVTSAKLEEHCQRLLERLRRHFGRNMGKFELYATRNIFVLPQDGAGGSSSSSSSSSSTSGGGSRGSGGSSSSGEDASLEEITAEVDKLRAKYHELQATHTTLTTETRDGGVLLRDMRDAIYKVRVGSQVLEDHNVVPLSDNMAAMAANRKTLEDLCRQASGTNRTKT